MPVQLQHLDSMGPHGSELHNKVRSNNTYSALRTSSQELVGMVRSRRLLSLLFKCFEMNLEKRKFYK